MSSGSPLSGGVIKPLFNQEKGPIEIKNLLFKEPRQNSSTNKEQTQDIQIILQEKCVEWSKSDR